MPIYEYACQKCKAHLEVMQKITDKPLTRCKQCGGKLEKQWSATGVQFKGTGWYVTDYANKKTDKKESDAKSEATKADTKADAKTDTKTEPKADSKSDAKSDGAANKSTTGKTAKGASRD